MDDSTSSDITSWALAGANSTGLRGMNNLGEVYKLILSTQCFSNVCILQPLGEHEKPQYLVVTHTNGIQILWEWERASVAFLAS